MASDGWRLADNQVYDCRVFFFTKNPSTRSSSIFIRLRFMLYVLSNECVDSYMSMVIIRIRYEPKSV